MGKVWSFSGICDSNCDLQNCKAALWFQRDYKKKSDLDNYTRSLLKKSALEVAVTQKKWGDFTASFLKPFFHWFVTILGYHSHILFTDYESSMYLVKVYRG